MPNNSYAEVLKCDINFLCKNLLLVHQKTRKTALMQCMADIKFFGEPELFFQEPLESNLMTIKFYNSRFLSEVQ